MKLSTVLIHGTFASNAKWSQRGSELSRNLTEAHAAKTEPIRFRWSGRNSPQARHLAAMELRDMLEDMLRASPTVNFLLIGHSHGGTVAMKAVDCDSLRERSYVVCLSTPFLQVFPRPIPSITYTQLCLPLAFLFVWFGVRNIVQSLGYPHFLNLMPSKFNFNWDLLGFLVITMFLVLTKIKERLLFRASETADVIQHVPNIACERVWLLRTVGDEASSWIGIFQVLSWLSSRCGALYISTIRATLNRFRSITERGYDVVVDHSTEIGFAISIQIALLLVAGYVSNAAVSWSKYLHWIAAAILLIPVAILFIAAMCYLLYRIAPYLGVEDPESMVGVFFSPVLLLLIPISLIFSLFGLLGFGVGTGLLTLFFEVSVESAPIGTWNVTHFPALPTGTIRHSQLYDDLSVIIAICNLEKNLIDT